MGQRQGIGCIPIMIWKVTDVWATNFLKTDIYSAKKQPWDVDMMEINMSRNKSKWKFRTEDKDGVEYAYINGYDFGDRLLEGVLFKIIIENNRSEEHTSELQSQR